MDLVKGAGKILGGGADKENFAKLCPRNCSDFGIRKFTSFPCLPSLANLKPPILLIV